jgi:hypothetical protein
MGNMEANIIYSPYITFVKLKKVMPPAMEWADNIHLNNKAFHNNAIRHGT